ncbi:Protein VAC14 -like protein [Trichinella patagoniensis]|uniref:Protein VAC14 homolog n=1 Tax=Trichinella patagoniensis TaxID=990121 RepID=A0A0V0ZE04_9BILA|nr:Protein VAC14 -like protein [Trichinella patagoniensis]
MSPVQVAPTLSDNPSSILSTSLVRHLTDKIYEKRKVGALELQKLVVDYINQNQMEQVEKIITILNGYVRALNPHTRKGGLLGLAAVAIALGKHSEKYSNVLLVPVLECLQDIDTRVRYYACEASYNIIKIARETALLQFSVLFDALCKLAADPDKNTRSGAELMERQLKDIAIHCNKFDVFEFVCLLRERIYAKNSFVRRYLISWVHDLQSQPNINLLQYLPEILDGLFQILTEPTPKIREACEVVLGQFLREIIQKPEAADLEHMVNVLIVHAQSNDCFAKYNALMWLHEFLKLDGSRMKSFLPGYVLVTLPCLAYAESDSDILQVSRRINTGLMTLVSSEKSDNSSSFELSAMVEVLLPSLNDGEVSSKIAALKWIHYLYEAMSDKFFIYMEELFPCLLRLLSDPSDEVVALDVTVLSDLCTGKEGYNTTVEKFGLPAGSVRQLKAVSPYFVHIMKSLLDEFRSDCSFLHDRGTFIIRQLCSVLNVEDVFHTLAVLLNVEQDLDYVSRVVQILNSIFLTAPELFSLRNKLKDMPVHDESNDRNLFSSLYLCWAHQPVALLALCLIARKYKHAANIVHHFSELEVNADLLVEIDKLIQLIESPIFTSLRLHLLDPRYQADLAAVLYGLLMLLPQTEAFLILKRRLQCMPTTLNFGMHCSDQLKANEKSSLDQNAEACVFRELMEHFILIQQKHREYNTGKLKLKMREPF